VYIGALHAHARIALSGVFLLCRVDNRIHTYSTKNRPFWTLAEVLANYTCGKCNKQESQLIGDLPWCEMFATGSPFTSVKSASLPAAVEPRSPSSFMMRAALSVAFCRTLFAGMPA
jgi:hypothetical protein